MNRDEGSSRAVARAAISLAMTESREEEGDLKRSLLQRGIRGAAVDYGGEFVASVMRMVERAVLTARRDGLIGEDEEGAVAGAAREAISQVSAKAMGLSVGGKIGVARCEGHVAVAVFFTVGLAHFNEVCVGMGHRAI